MRPSYLYPDYPSGICVYCGELADTVDHLLPRQWSGDADRKRVPVVPACQECNSTLGAVFLPDVQDRRALVHAKYRQKYKKALTMLYRTEEGLDEFGPSLRHLIERMQAQHDAVMRRLAWPTDPTYDADAWAYAWTAEEPPAEAGG